MENMIDCVELEQKEQLQLELFFAAPDTEVSGEWQEVALSDAAALLWLCDDPHY